MRRRLAALALSLALAAGLLPAVAFATGNGNLTAGTATLTAQTEPDLSYEGVRVVGGQMLHGVPQTVAFEARSDVANYNEPEDEWWNYGDFTLYKDNEIIATKKVYFKSDGWLKGEFITWKASVTEVGKYHVTFRGHGLSTTGNLFTASFTVDKAQAAKKANTMIAKAKTVTFKASKAKAKAQSTKASKAFGVKKAKGTVTYKATRNVTKNAIKKVKVAKNGKVTVKQGTKKGTYKLKVKITAAGNSSYKAKSKTVTLVVKVK